MMNTKSTRSSLFFLLAICFILFNCKDKKVQVPIEEEVSEKITVNRPDEIIEIAEANIQYLTYKKRRVDLIQRYEDSVDTQQKGIKTEEPKTNENDPNGNRFDVARYVYWDYQTIKNYLNYIENEAAEANVDISTLRFCFTNNPPENKSAIHPRQNSIIITPTLREKNREYIFAIDDSDIKNIKPLLLTDDFVPIVAPIKGNGQTSKDHDKKSYASFFPNTRTNNTALEPAPLFAVRSVSMNKGNSAPPPY